MAPVPKPKPTNRQPHFLRQWRLHKGLTQEEAAERVEIDRTTLSRIEGGSVPYNQDLLERLALAYGCETADLISMNPASWDGPKLVYDALRRAPIAMQRQAVAVIEALLKQGAA